MFYDILTYADHFSQMKAQAHSPLTRAKQSSRPLNSSKFVTKRRLESPTLQPTKKVIEILTNLIGKINFLPLPIFKTNSLKTQLEALIHLVNQHKGTASRSTSEFWQSWDNFNNDFVSFVGDLTIESYMDVCNTQLTIFEDGINVLKQNPPKNEDNNGESYLTLVQSLSESFSQLKKQIQQSFEPGSPTNSTYNSPNNDKKNNSQNDDNVSTLSNSLVIGNPYEDSVIRNTRGLIQPLVDFLELLKNQNYHGLFFQSGLPQKESTEIRNNCVHSIEVILDLVKGLRSAIKTRVETMEKFFEDESALESIFPRPVKRKLFNPKSYSQLLQKKKSVQNENIQKKELLSRREVSLLIDKRRELMKQCEMSNILVEDKEQIMNEIIKRRNNLTQRENAAKTEALKNEIIKKREILQALEDNLQADNDTTMIEKEITQLREKLADLNENSDLHKKVIALRAERDEYITNNQNAEKRLYAIKRSNFQDDERKEIIQDDVSSMINEKSRLKEQISFLQGEQYRLLDDIIREKAQNNYLAETKKNGSGKTNINYNLITENAKLREQKFKLLNDIQRVREDIEILKCFQTKSSHLGILPESNILPREKLQNEYKAALKANATILKQKESLKESLLSSQKRREQLLYNSALCEFKASDINDSLINQTGQNQSSSPFEGNQFFSKILKINKEYNELQRFFLNKKINELNAIFDKTKMETDMKILKMRKDLVAGSKADFNKKLNVEGNQETEIMKNEMKSINNNTSIIKNLILELDLLLAEVKTIKAALTSQNTSIQRKTEQQLIEEEIEQMSEKNHQLRLLTEETKLQLKEIDEQLGANKNLDNDIPLSNRLQSIEARLGAVDKVVLKRGFK